MFWFVHPVLQFIHKLWKAGEVVKVVPEYFRNHLMPKMLAVPNNNKFAILIQEQRKVPHHSLFDSIWIGCWLSLTNRFSLNGVEPAGIP
jgi:hypothetical protein